MTVGVVWVVVSITALAAVGWGVVAVRKATRVPRYHLDLTPADLHLPYEPLTLTAADGTRLAGWRMIPPAPKGVVVVQHGYGTSRADPLQLSAMVYRGGYAVVSVDFRGHGESTGHCTFGRGERGDIVAALDAIEADPRMRGLSIGYFGISMGAAIGILTAAQESRIRALVSDSSYAWLGAMVARYQWMAYRLPVIPFGWVTGACLALALRTPLWALDPVRAIRRLQCPILIIHGEHDVSIPVSHATALHAAAPAPKELWIIPGAAHVAGYYQAEEDYARRVVGFLDRSVGAS